MSCTTPRRLYISNKTDNAITLNVDHTFDTNDHTMQCVFKDSLNGKRIEPGHIIINFETGKKWDKSDEESLKHLLPYISIKKDGSAKSFKLSNNIKIGHGLFIPELIIKINELSPEY